jgi:antitoxin HicB
MKKQALTYTLEIERHDDGYLAYFPALPGCHTWGKTYEEAVNHAEEALVGFLEALQKNGEEIPVEQPSAPVSLGLVVELPAAV